MDRARLLLLLQLIEDAKTTNYATVAAVTVLVFDYFLTLEKEIELIWKTPKKLASLIYLWFKNRYFSLVALGINASFMLREVNSDKLMGITITIIISTVDLVLLMRVWILYGRSKKLLYLMIPLISGEFVTMLVLDYHVVFKMQQYVHVGPMLEGCYSMSKIFNQPLNSRHLSMNIPAAPRYYAFMAVPPLIVSFIMFVMTIYKCGRTLFTNRGIARTPVVSLFMRDGIFWFLAVFAVMVPQAVIAAGARVTIGEVMISICLATYSIISSRVLLNIKEIMLATEYGDTTIDNEAKTDSYQLDTIQFHRRGVDQSYISRN
ncbi:hypothetical protein VNI00_012219 [Paramarasmius palmivorus]|uniref:DUF6533 domain-containing protein n=1 Tax=Paramarasmius palmivorus TaxID=297713 RepID=A0AAW0C7T4_9AGAR